MKHRAHFAILALISISAACNYTDGPCWPVGQDGNGDPVVGSPGTGNTGDGAQDQPHSGMTYNCNATAKSAPPQSKPPPQASDTGAGTGGAGPACAGDADAGAICNIVQQSICDEKCLADYMAAATVCGKIEIDAQRKTCQDNAYAVYKQCRAVCEDDPKEKCKKKCDKVHDKCHAKCTKSDPSDPCHAKCNDEYGACLKDCDS
jgi:hypothetical protein